ncbi:Protein OSM-8 [Aphelenchoides avenae]|nr:Protein OSM-8 [Aphelenchus avenae]
MPTQLLAPKEEKDIFGFPKIEPLTLANPFTVNPLIAMFTTAALPTMPPIPEVKGIDISKLSRRFNPLHAPILPMRDPFYNPLLPNRRNKLAELFNTPTS